MKSFGQFGKFGGMYVAELLVPVLEEIETAFLKYKEDATFNAELNDLFTHFLGRSTPITECKKLSEKYGCTVVLKREDLLHGGAHKGNNVIGQALLAKHMGKKTLIAETGAGQHGVATAMAGALFDMPTLIFMGEKDVERQAPNVQRMMLYGAEVVTVKNGSRSLKDAINDALRYWISHTEDIYYVFGTVAGPHPFPTLVAHFHRVIGDEAREQIQEQYNTLPHSVAACIGGGSNAMGIFKAFVDDSDVKLYGVEPAGEGVETAKHGAPLAKGHVGSFHGSISYYLQNSDGQLQESHSISAGLDYPGVGPEHSYLKDSGRAEYISATDQEAIDAFIELTREEGIIPALESAHALAKIKDLSSTMQRNDILLINLSGRGDKDLDHVNNYFENNT